MIKMEIKPKLDTFVSTMKKLPKKIQNEAKRELVDIATDMKNQIIEKMQRTPRGGDGYKRGNKIYFASLPGNAPASDGGDLWNSFEIAKRMSGFTVEVGTNVFYAKYLDGKGTKKMAPRPIKANMIENIDIEKRIRDAVARGFKL